MSKRWHNGPPPSVGWWPTTCVLGSGLRWWSGEYWSLPARPGNDLVNVHYAASIRSVVPVIKWQHRPKSWPKRSKT